MDLEVVFIAQAIITTTLTDGSMDWLHDCFAGGRAVDWFRVTTDTCIESEVQRTWAPTTRETSCHSPSRSHAPFHHCSNATPSATLPARTPTSTRQPPVSSRRRLLPPPLIQVSAMGMLDGNRLTGCRFWKWFQNDGTDYRIIRLLINTPHIKRIPRDSRTVETISAASVCGLVSSTITLLIQFTNNTQQHAVYFNLAAIGWIHVTCTK